MIRVEDQRAGRDADDHVMAALAVHLLAHAGFAALGFPMVLSGKIQERALAVVGDEDDVATVAAIATVGAAFGDELLAPEGDGARPTVAGLHVDFSFIDEHKKKCPLSVVRRPLQVAKGRPMADNGLKSSLG